MLSPTDYFFLAVVLLPPISLAIGFLYLVSPGRLHREELREAASHSH